MHSTLIDKLTKPPVKVKVPGHMLKGFAEIVFDFVTVNNPKANIEFKQAALNHGLVEVLAQLKKGIDKAEDRLNEGKKGKDETLKISYLQYRALACLDAEITGGVSDTDLAFNNVCYQITSTCHKYYLDV